MSSPGMTPRRATLHHHHHEAPWRAEELRPSVLLTSVLTGVLLYAVGIMPILALATLVFSGQLSVQLSAGVGYALIGSAVVGGVVGLLSSYRGSIAIAQDAPAVLLAVIVGNVVATLPPASTQAGQFASIVLVLTIAAFITGLLYLLLGVFKLAG